MLIEFSVRNYGSIKERQTLSLVKDKGGELKNNSFDLTKPSKIKLLKSLAIYGANASGKSTIIAAIEAMRKLIVISATKLQRGDELNLRPFLFDEQSVKEPTEFEVVFVTEGVRYQYGFVASNHRVFEEWLYAFPKGRQQLWFSRVYDQQDEQTYYKFGDALLGQKVVWQQATRDNALFLSTAIHLNSTQLQVVFDWFKDTLNVLGMGDIGSGFTASLCDGDKNIKAKVIEFMQAADIGIHDIKVDKKELNAEDLPDELPDEVKQKLLKELEGGVIRDIQLLRQVESGKQVPLDFKYESEGTRKLFSYIGPWIDALTHGYIFVIDELHDSLHPKLVEFLVKLFHDPLTNPNNAQLIFTTHETSILNQEVFRRDQVWFCEKNSQYETELYSLSEFSPRKGRENLEAGYLSGRYGGLPFIGEFKLEV